MLDKILPNLSLAQCETLYALGEALIYDDRHDLGYFSYTNRNNHYYNGKRAPNHRSPFHHWMLGAALIVLSQIGGLITLTREDDEEYQDENFINDHNNYPVEEEIYGGF